MTSSQIGRCLALRAELALALSLCCALIVGSPAVGLAQTARPAPAGAAALRDGLAVDVRLSVGGLHAEYTRPGRYELAEFGALSIDGGLRIGGFSNGQLLIGYDLAAGYHIRVGDFVVSPGAFGGEPQPIHHNYGVFAPFGIFFEVYPFSDLGAYLGASGGLGSMWLPGYSRDTSDAMVHYGFELGYDLSGSSVGRLGAFARYQRWVGFALDSSGTAIQSQGGNVGARWSFF